MPNWVYNGLTVEGNPDEVNKLIGQMNASFEVPVQTMGMGDISTSGFPTKVEQVKYTNPVFAFWNIIKPTDMDAYVLQPSFMNGKGEPKENKDSWYNWNNRNWGVKWDVAVADENEYSDTYMEGPTENGENLVVYYNFNTPWGIPIQALETLSSQFPSLLFTLSYEEETGWGGEDEFMNGKHVEGASWNWACSDCDEKYIGDPDDLWCDDCESIACPKCFYTGNNDEDNCDKHRNE